MIPIDPLPTSITTPYYGILPVGACSMQRTSFEKENFHFEPPVSFEFLPVRLEPSISEKNPKACASQNYLGQSCETACDASSSDSINV